MSENDIAYINFRILKNTREELGLSIEEAARNVLSEKTLIDAEEGKKRLSFTQAINLANKYHVPITYFYLKEPKKIEIIENFRTIKSKPVQLTPIIRQTLVEIKEKREFVLEFQKYDKEYDYSYVKSIDLTENPDEVGKKVDARPVTNRKS